MRARVGIRLQASGGVHVTDPVNRSPWKLGTLLMGAMVGLAVAALLAERPVPTIETRGAAGPSQALPGFRADAWYLPDDPLLGFVEVSAGPFAMGSDSATEPPGYDNEYTPGRRPQVVDLPAFWIGRFEVTVAQYTAFVAATGHVADPQALNRAPTHPVAFVSWPDAVAYARWLDGELRASDLTPGPVARRLAEGWRVALPNEAQWEKAARSDDGRVFPWGDAPGGDAPRGDAPGGEAPGGEAQANFAGTATTPVGSFDCPECVYGLSDMSGNVWEWTTSPNEPYPYSPLAGGVRDLEADALWVMRGGSYADEARNSRAAVRGAADPGARRAFIGFRVVVSAP